MSSKAFLRALILLADLICLFNHCRFLKASGVHTFLDITQVDKFAENGSKA